MKHVFRGVLGALGIFMIIGDAMNIAHGKQLPHLPFLPSISIFALLLIQHKLESMGARKG